MTQGEQNSYIAKTIMDLLKLPPIEALVNPDGSIVLDSDDDVEQWVAVAAGKTNMRDLDVIFNLNNMALRFESKVVKTRKLWAFIRDQL